MKKYLMTMVALAVAVALASPVLAAVEFKYGGQFRNRITGSTNIYDGTDEGSDNLNFIDQRLRVYFTFQASENLKVVWKLEVGDTTWGNDWPTAGTATLGKGGRVGADSQNVETKNAYIDFNIPNTLVPIKVISGIQTLNLLNSWIVDDDFSAIVAKAKLDPFALTLGYVGAQNYDLSHSVDNIDSWFLALDWMQKPFSASLIGYYQYGRDTIASLWPWYRSPVGGPIPNTTTLAAGSNFGASDMFRNGLLSVSDNNLFDLGFNFTYKIDWLSAYVSFVKNFGSFDLNRQINVGGSTDPRNYSKFKSMDYTGWMVDAGVTYYCGPWTANIGGFYTSGQEFPERQVVGYRKGGQDTWDLYRLYMTSIDSSSGGDFDRFALPLAQWKYFSEIIGGGVLSDSIDVGFANGWYGSQTVQRGNFWAGYPSPANIWTVTAGGSYQLLPKTKLSASYWYFGTSEDVPISVKSLGLMRNNRWIADYEMDNEIGHEFNVYLDHEIVDGLQLTLVAAYLVAGDAFSPIAPGLGGAPVKPGPGGQLPAHLTRENADDAFEFGARLQWNF